MEEAKPNGSDKQRETDATTPGAKQPSAAASTYASNEEASAQSPQGQDRTTSVLLPAEAGTDQGSQEVVTPTDDTELYNAIAPQDGIEAMLARSSMGMASVAVKAAARALASEDPAVQEKHFKIAVGANTTLIKLSDAMADHRRAKQPRHVTHRFSFK